MSQGRGKGESIMSKLRTHLGGNLDVSIDLALVGVLTGHRGVHIRLDDLGGGIERT